MSKMVRRSMYNYESKPLGNFKINEKISMLPLHPIQAPCSNPEPPLEIKEYYHSSPKYGASRYTSSLVAGKMHKLIHSTF